MKKSLLTSIFTLAMIVLTGHAWGELPSAAWTWDGSGATQDGALDSGETIYKENNHRVTVESKVTGNAFTYAFWVKRGADNWQDIVSLSTSQRGFKLEQKRADQAVAVYETFSTTGATETSGISKGDAELPISNSTFTHVVIVNSNGSFTFYLDGAVSTTFSDITAVDAWTDVRSEEKITLLLGIGCSYPYNGGGVERGSGQSWFADMKLYDAAFTADQVKELYDDYATRAAAMAYQRTVTETAVDWSATDAWTFNEEKFAAPAEGKPVRLTVDADSTITMNAAATVGALTIGGSAKATFAGDNSLTAASTAVNTDTDVTGITADLGATTIVSDKTLSIGANTSLSVANGANSGTIHVTGGTTDAPIVLNCGTAANDYIGAVTVAADTYLRLHATGGNKAYNIAGNGETSHVILTSGQDWGVSNNNNSKIQNCTLEISGDNNFWLTPSKIGENVHLVIGTGRVITLENETTTLSLASLSGEGKFHDSNCATTTFKITDGSGKTFSGTIKKNHSVVKEGEGTQIFSGANTYSGTTTISGGTLKLTGSGTLGTGTVTVDANGTLTYAANATPANTFTGAGTITADACKLDLSGATLTDYTGAFTLANNGTLILPAGAEGTITVPAGSSLQLVLSEAQLATEYTAANVTVADGATFSFVDSEGNPVGDGVDGTSYKSPVPAWKPTGSTLTFDSTDCWSGGEVPAEGAIVIDTSAYAGEDAIALVVSKSYSSITVVGNTEKVTAISFADGVTVAPAISITGKVKVPFAALGGVSVADGSVLIVDVASDAALTAVPSGTYAFWKDGAGILTLNTNLTPANGTKILAGTIKYSSGVIGTAYNDAADVTVCNGATLDFGGKVDGFTRYVTLEAGATLKNTGGNIGADKRQLAGVILTGDATIENSGNFGLIAGGWGETVLTLNGHTLTKKGTGAFWLCSTTVDNGTIKIEDGRIAFENDKTSTLGDIVLDVAGDNVWQRTAGTVNYSGTITKQGAGSVTIDQVISASKTITVGAGTLKLTAANTRSSCATIIESGATLDLTTEGATLYNADAYTGQELLTVRGTLQVASDSAYGYFATRYDGTTLDGGTLEIAGDITCDRCFNTTEKGGSILVREGYTYAINAYSGGEPNWAFIFKVNIDGALTKKGGGTLVLHTPVSGYKHKTGITTTSAAPTELSSGGITVEAGTLVLNGANTYAGETTIASGATLSGTGTIPAGLTLANGATINASANKINVTGDVTLPAEGTVTVTLPAEPGVGTEVLACANAATLDLTKLSAAPEGLKWVAVDGVIELATATVCKIGDTEYETLADALADATSGTEITMVADSAESITLPTGVKLIMGDYTVTSVKDVYGADLTVDAEGNYTGPTYVAKAEGMALVETGYTSLQDAVNAAAGSMGTVTLLADLTVESPIEVNTAESWFRIDLGGKTLTSTGSSAFFVKAGNPIIMNGTINATGVGIWICEKTTSADVAPFDFTTNPYGNACVTLDSTLTVKSSSDNCVLMYNGAVLSTAAKLTSSGEYATIQGSGAWGSNPNNATMITITGGSVTSTDNHAIYHPQPGTLTITGGEISGVTGIEMRAGTLAMSGGTVTATGTYAEPGANNSGSTVNGAAIVLSQHSTGKNVTATITGGAITATGTDGKTFVVANTTGADPVDIEATIAAGVKVDLTAAEVLIDTLELTGDADTGYSLTEKAAVTYVAQIGDAKYETLAEAFSAGATSAGVKITLLGNTTENISVPAGFNGTLDLDGNTVTGTIKAETDANPVITIENGNLFSSAYVLHFYSGSLTLNNVNVTANKTHGLRLQGPVECVINSGTYQFTDETLNTTSGFNMLYLYKNSGAKVTVNGGTFTWAGGSTMAISNQPGAYLTINGGEFIGTSWTGGELTITGGIIHGISIAIGSATSISGGTFKAKQSAYLAAGYKFVDSTVVSGYFDVVEQVLVAPGAPLEVEAAGETAALNMVDGIAVTVPEIDGLTADAYKAYFKLVATETATDKYTVSAVLNPDVVTPTISAIAIGEGATVTVAEPKPGLYYSVKTMTEVNGEATASTGTLATDSEALSLTVKLPDGDKAFFKAAVDYKQ